jgi:hypothetical protein
MDPHEALALVSRTLAERTDLTPLEAKRLARDLERVATRLRNGDYEKSPFEDNVLNLPDRTHQVMVEVEFMSAVGRAWARILAPLGIATARRVIDLGPGWAPKVEMGLYYTPFDGELIMINQDAGAIDTLTRFLTLLDVRFTRSVATVDLFAWRGAPADFVLANHLLDDLVLDRHCRRTGTDPTSLYARESAFREAWTTILAQPRTETDTLVEALAETVARLTRPGGVAAFVQYPSYAERTLGLTEVVAHGRAILHDLGALLLARGFTDHADDTRRALASGDGPFGPEHCMVMRAPTR